MCTCMCWGVGIVYVCGDYRGKHERSREGFTKELASEHHHKLHIRRIKMMRGYKFTITSYLNVLLLDYLQH